MSVLFWLIVSHFVCDYPLQSDFMAKGKNRHTAITGMSWWIIMAAHCAVHAGGVALATSNWKLGIAEFVFHYFIDCGKCEGVLGFKGDQALHLACKGFWFTLVLMGATHA